MSRSSSSSSSSCGGGSSNVVILCIRTLSLRCLCWCNSLFQGVHMVSLHCGEEPRQTTPNVLHCGWTRRMVVGDG